jgi:hypothetical protein
VPQQRVREHHEHLQFAHSDDTKTFNSHTLYLRLGMFLVTLR